MSICATCLFLIVANGQTSFRNTESVRKIYTCKIGKFQIIDKVKELPEICSAVCRTDKQVAKLIKTPKKKEVSIFSICCKKGG